MPDNGESGDLIITAMVLLHLRVGQGPFTQRYRRPTTNVEESLQ